MKDFAAKQLQTIAQGFSAGSGFNETRPESTSNPAFAGCNPAEHIDPMPTQLAANDSLEDEDDDEDENDVPHEGGRRAAFGLIISLARGGPYEESDAL
jgi:hypothetical protein